MEASNVESGFSMKYAGVHSIRHALGTSNLVIDFQLLKLHSIA
jgi:hypothetical protein